MREMADFDVKDFEDENSTKGVYARFYWRPKKDEAASAAEGRPIFKDTEYVEIIAAGNSNNIVARPVSDMDRVRFRQAYAKFKEGDADQLVGTPLIELPWLTRSQVEELAYMKIRTVEQLATLNDAACGIPGMFDLKRKAEAWVKKAEGAAPFTALQKENEDLKARIAALEELLKKPAATAKG